MSTDPTPPPTDGLYLAILGTRGIPARYGGFETFAEELSTRLVQRGYSVDVYARTPLFGPRRKTEEVSGVRVVYVPTVMTKHLETPIHALISFLRLFIVRPRPDVILLCNAANSPFSWIARLLGIPVAINVDGIERLRAKWGMVAKWWYRLGERCSVWFASRVVADAAVIADYYRKSYGCSTEVIAYGATAHPIAAGKTLEHLGLQPGRYILYVSRLEPENNALGVVSAYRNVAGDTPLVIVGDAPYAKDYIARVRAAADGRVIFTGFQFGEAYHELQSNCALYIQATEVGGTHPALIEAMAHGNCVIANGTPENREVLADCGLFYRTNDFQELAELIARLLGDVEERALHGRRAKARAHALYAWDRITSQYQELFSRIAPC